MDIFAKVFSELFIVSFAIMAGLTIIWSTRSKAFLAEIINSFPWQLIIGNALALTILFMFSTAIENISSAVWWALLFNSLCILIILVRVATFATIKPKYAINTEKILRVGSFNKQVGAKNTQLIVKRAHEIDLDVLGISEIKPYDFPKFKNAGYDYSYHTNKRYGLGQAEFLLLSKYKLISPKPVSLDQFGNALRFEINKDGKKIAIYIVHTTAPISPELFEKRNEGFNILAKAMTEDSADRVIMFGDLNITPYSLIYSRFINSLKNKFYNASQGRGFVYTWSYFGLIATHLDHIFVSENLGVVKFKVDRKLGSDHNLIWADVSF